jgi:hypothetical protein
LIITSLARDDTARRPATTITRTCGGLALAYPDDPEMQVSH